MKKQLTKPELHAKINKSSGLRMTRKLNLGVFPSGQWGQTVNLLLFSFGGSNPPAPTKNSSVVKILEFLFYLKLYKETLRVDSNSIGRRPTSRRQKSPSGAFLDARLANPCAPTLPTPAGLECRNVYRDSSTCWGRVGRSIEQTEQEEPQ